MRKPILRLKRNGHMLEKIQVLSDGGNFVVQELPVRSVTMQYEAGGLGVVTLELHADLVEVTQP